MKPTAKQKSLIGRKVRVRSTYYTWISKEDRVPGKDYTRYGPFEKHYREDEGVLVDIYYDKDMAAYFKNFKNTPEHEDDFWELILHCRDRKDPLHIHLSDETVVRPA